MTNPFEKTENWIETGPDGHHFYVRKKQPPALPSFKAIFREAVHDLWHGPSPFWKDFKRASTQRAAINTAAADGPQIFCPFRNTSCSTIHPPNMQPHHDDPSSKQPRGILKPDPQRYPSDANGGPPLAGVPPFIQPIPQRQQMHATQYNPQQPFGGYSAQLGYNTAQVYNPLQRHLSTHNLPPGLTQPVGGFQGQPLPQGAGAISPPRYPTQEDLKYKCAVCGRFRSTRYHYKHPLAPGQLPGITICRNCRDAATDSEDESIVSTDSYVHQARPHRRNSRGFSRASSVGHRTKSGSNCRGRSRSRPVASDDDTYLDDGYRQRRRSMSRSSSIENDQSMRSRSVLVPRRRSPSVEELEIVRRPRPRPTRRVICVDEEESGYTSEYDENDIDVRS
ncbi:uncharacterized protein HMPREF1541_08264 [Cyphellophora europaea CBS 101466]|uniref:Uncharacterized protein n=1 Tax=Cyphellophora europaea (strain CBS 101466) TaxID=1220924 RepID=W2RNJ4_CYPE1|nr:uncharacterized protein HMPREF1541_08264 [Cyphellophora europaea CBS 101466]ETN37273.1 hypothetical protein HMPREF1541_08264 [Cyphellophora europaea CBS 101466]